MNRTGLLIGVIVLAALVGASVGCSKKTSSTGAVAELPPSTESPAETIPGPSTPGETPTERPAVLELEDVYFAFDDASLRPDARQTLTRNARALEDWPSARILIEGHCDERGTQEYNLALGDRRARSAQDFLTRYGISATRIEAISYGEERPFDPGHSEAAWARNRRAHFVIRR